MSAKIYRGFVPTEDQVLTMSDLLANTATVTVYAGLSFAHPQQVLDYVTGAATTQLGLTLTWDLDAVDEQDLTYAGTLTIATTAAGQLGTYLGLADPVVVANTLHIASVPQTVLALELSPFTGPLLDLHRGIFRGGVAAISDGTAETITTGSSPAKLSSIRFRVLGSEMADLLTEQDQWAAGTPFTIYHGITSATDYWSGLMLGTQSAVQWEPVVLADGIEWRGEVEIVVTAEG